MKSSQEEMKWLKNCYVEDGEDIQEIFKDVETWLESWFDYIKPWNEDIVIGQRFTWMRCAGIPLHARNESFFRTIMGCLGTYMDEYENTRNKKRLDVARIRVRTSTLQLVMRTMRIKINGKIFVIRMIKELFVENEHKKFEKEAKGNMVEEKEEDKSSEESVFSQYDAVELEYSDE
ncbi:hypothetical protein RIF29_14935 [Crotalaria pallida]|uniref:DUF4283 domain-containing protein n=1 Tax=Crotalaria pallida TaxID=3830 RepID=A0AAN9FGD3_CROPI